MYFDPVDLTADVIRTEDLIERLEQLEAWRDSAYATEAAALRQILISLSDVGGSDVRWRGGWLPADMIAGHCFAGREEWTDGLSPVTVAGRPYFTA